MVLVSTEQDDKKGRVLESYEDYVELVKSSRTLGMPQKVVEKMNQASSNVSTFWEWVKLTAEELGNTDWGALE